MARLVENTIVENFDRFTGEPFNANKVTNWWNGTPMNDTKVDNAEYFKVPEELGGGYAKRSDFDAWGKVSVKSFGAKGDGVTDDYQAIQDCINKSNNTIIIFPQGVYAFSQTLSLPTDKQIVLRGEGRNSEHGPDFGIGDCIAKLKFVGTDPSVTAAIRSTSGQLNWEFQTIYLANASGRQDVDGIILDRYVRGAFSNCVVFSFRNNIVINDYYYYTHFFKCRFGYPWENNFLANNIANGCTFYRCSFQGGGEARPSARGFYSTNRSGDLINFEQCEFENHSREGIYISQIRNININGCYIEGNHTAIEGQRTQQIYLGSYTNNLRTPTVLNIRGCHITVHQGIDLINVQQSDNVNNGNSKLNIVDNNFVHDSSWTLPIAGTSNPVTFVILCQSNASKLELYLSNNAASRHFITDSNIYIAVCNVGPSGLADFSAVNDDLVKLSYPDYQGYIAGKGGSSNGLKVTSIKAVPPAISFRKTNRDVETRLEIDHPTLATAPGGLDIGKRTNTTSRYRTRFFKSNGTQEELGYFNHETGNFAARGFVVQNGPFNPNEFVGIGYFAGSGSPEGRIAAQRGSLYLDENTGYTYKKFSQGSGNTGWALSGNRTTPAPNTATEATGTAPTKAEFDALLAELRDLKQRMMAQGLISP